MESRRARPALLASLTAGLAVPVLAKGGAAVIAAGLVADFVEHVLIEHAHETEVAGVALGEHAAHLVVLVGMVLVLVGIVADGVRTQRRLARQKGTPRHAVR